MTAIDDTTIDSAGVRTRLLRGGPKRQPILFLHGGIPGVTLYGSGAHLWSAALPLFARERTVIAPDLPGFGDAATADGVAGIEAQGRFVLALIDTLKLGACHIVGHDEGGLVGMWLALEAPDRVRSVSIVAAPTCAPMGDGIPPLALANPPRPLWSRASQAWALERLSYSQHHIDAALLDRSVACTEAAPHREAAAQALAGAQPTRFLGSVAKVKARLYTVCRDSGITVPVQLVWARQDPLTTIEHGMVLYKLLAAKQTATHFHIVNRAGTFPEREAPEAFHQMVAAFHDGVADERAR